MKIALLGDIALFGKYSLKNNNVYQYFEDIAAKLKQYDYVIGNLETPLINYGKPYGAKSAHIKSDEKNVALLKFLNINIVNLSNNHIYDYGEQGYERTKMILDQNLIKYFGIESKQVYINENNNRIAFSGYCCYSTNALGYNTNRFRRGIDVLDGFQVEKNMIFNNENGYLNIISVHAGQEHVNYPNNDHIDLARLLTKNGSYIYYGHHPHVMQGIEQVNGSLLAYSLGNFCFDDVYTEKSEKPLVTQTEENRRSYILEIEIINSRIMNYELIPLFMGDHKANILNSENLVNLKTYSEALKLDRHELFHRRNRILINYYKSRKRNRNLKWYLSRLNINSIKIILNAKKNSRLYQKSILSYILARSHANES